MKRVFSLFIITIFQILILTNILSSFFRYASPLSLFKLENYYSLFSTKQTIQKIYALDSFYFIKEKNLLNDLYIKTSHCRYYLFLFYPKNLKCNQESINAGELLVTDKIQMNPMFKLLNKGTTTFLYQKIEL